MSLSGKERQKSWQEACKQTKSGHLKVSSRECIGVDGKDGQGEQMTPQ